MWRQYALIHSHNPKLLVVSRRIRPEEVTTVARSQKALNRQRSVYKRKYAGKDYYLGRASVPTLASWLKAMDGANYGGRSRIGHNRMVLVDMTSLRPRGAKLTTETVDVSSINTAGILDSDSPGILPLYSNFFVRRVYLVPQSSEVEAAHQLND
jgi:hypothetical protein